MNKNQIKILYILILLLIVYVIYNYKYYEGYYEGYTDLTSSLNSYNIKFKKEGNKIVAFSEQQAIQDQPIPEADRPIIFLDIVPYSKNFTFYTKHTILPGETFDITVQPQGKYKARVLNDSNDKSILFSSFFDTKLPPGFTITNVSKDMDSLFYVFSISTTNNVDPTTLQFKVKKGVYIFDTIPNSKYKESPESNLSEIVIGIKLNNNLSLPSKNNIYTATLNKEFNILLEIPNNYKNKYIVEKPDVKMMYRYAETDIKKMFDTDPNKIFKGLSFATNSTKSGIIFKATPIKKGIYYIIFTSSGLVIVDKNNKSNKTGNSGIVFDIRVK